MFDESSPDDARGTGTSLPTHPSERGASIYRTILYSPATAPPARGVVSDYFPEAEESAQECAVSGTKAVPLPSLAVAERAACEGLVDATEQNTAVVPAEPHPVRDRVRQVGLARLIGDVVEVALGIGVLVVDRRRDD